jgi:hypothetical protein
VVPVADPPGLPKQRCASVTLVAFLAYLASPEVVCFVGTSLVCLEREAGDSDYHGATSVACPCPFGLGAGSKLFFVGHGTPEAQNWIASDFAEQL